MENLLNPLSPNDRSTLGKLIKLLTLIAISGYIIGKAIIELPKIIKEYTISKGVISYGDSFMTIKPSRNSFNLEMKFKWMSKGEKNGVHKIEAILTDSLNMILSLLATKTIVNKVKQEFNSIDFPKDTLKVCKVVFSILEERNKNFVKGKAYWIEFRSYAYDNGPPITNRYRFDFSEKQVRLLKLGMPTTVTLSEIKN